MKKIFKTFAILTPVGFYLISIVNALMGEFERSVACFALGVLCEIKCEVGEIKKRLKND